ncbi:MAG: nicotinamide-nucleotide adenylyltransferase [Nitrososphaerota archaeon]|nr:nicotinamide-nucleotide adenylyltransferase [Nitrososphaerales archaeon]MDW8044601.1 nicotinamide-nucleotide adenylyltransferase [Nitrososphaerota archaeon]
MVRRGVFVGRFQPFHKGHLQVILELLKNVDELIIIIGSSQKSHELDNPFTTGERLTMIRESLRDAGVDDSRYWLIPVPDVDMHTLWVAQVLSYTPKFEVVYSNEPLTRRLFKEAGLRVESITFIKRNIFSATEIRRRMLSGENWEELVPQRVAAIINEIGGVERIKELSKKDIV